MRGSRAAEWRIPTSITEDAGRLAPARSRPL
jgi:hypothetical protein